MKTRLALQAALAGCAVLAGFAFWTAWRETLLAAYWENELGAKDSKEGETGEASRARTNEAIGRLLELGRPGLFGVVRTLGNPNDDLSRAAWRALDDWITRCENGPPNEAAPRIEDLALALADGVEELAVASRPRAAKLAMRIVGWLEKSPPLESGRTTAACHRVLRACDGSSEGVPPVQESVATVTVQAAETATNEEAHHVAHARTVLPADHSMYLELAELAAPELPRVQGADDAQPGLLSTTEAKPLAAKGTGSTRAATTSTARAADDGRSNHERSAAERLNELAAFELFARLSEPQDARAAAAELAARGFSARQTEVARHLVSHDAAERLRWAEVLPGIRGIDARFWLLRLSHDGNVQVRRSAIGLLATDRDPEVIRRLRQVAIEETDPDVRAQAGRALEILEGDSEGGP